MLSCRVRGLSGGPVTINANDKDCKNVKIMRLEPSSLVIRMVETGNGGASE